MRKKISLGAAVAAVLLCCLATFQLTYLLSRASFEKKYLSEALDAVHAGAQNGSANAGSQTAGETVLPDAESSSFLEKVNAKLSEVDSIFRSYYINDIDDDFLADCVLDGYIAGTKDAYGAYYNAAEFEDFMNDLGGELVGIGVNVIWNDDYQAIEVLSVIPDSPALKAGVEPGDLIWTVGDEKEPVPELGYYPTIGKLRGEIGTIATFSVLRGEGYSEEVDFKIARDKVTEVTVMYHVYGPDDSIAVVRITSFDATTPVQFVKAVELLRAGGCDKLIVDLRYNPGGELSSIVTTLDYILPEGPIVRIIDADGKEVDAYYSEASELDMPMAVLVNGSTASAAELFTSAVRDYHKATIVGTTTYGKGCMQTTIPLKTGGAVSVTYRMYNPPFSDNYHGIGIIPDVEVELDEELQKINTYKLTDDEDNQLAAAAATFGD
ncbi:MAG: S41 family peptidase [Clostridia bacterium]|nr:S41 family peptidase [Clostridia bacterium]